MKSAVNILNNIQQYIIKLTYWIQRKVHNEVRGQHTEQHTAVHNEVSGQYTTHRRVHNEVNSELTQYIQQCIISWKQYYNQIWTLFVVFDKLVLNKLNTPWIFFPFIKFLLKIIFQNFPPTTSIDTNCAYHNVNQLILCLYNTYYSNIYCSQTLWLTDNAPTKIKRK